MFRLQPTDIPTVINIINILINTSSYGNEKIPCKYIKDANEIIALYITVIGNTSIVTGIVPEQLEMEIVIPLHKNCDKEKAFI